MGREGVVWGKGGERKGGNSVLRGWVEGGRCDEGDGWMGEKMCGEGMGA